MKEKFSVNASWTDKDSRIPRFREIYESEDFLDAYAKHTDMRVHDDPHGAIGRSDEWESHGIMQLEFLIEQGLRPEHKLLDVGCGVGRAARRLVPYLDYGHYTGCDISMAALSHCEMISVAEGWAERRPSFLLCADLKLSKGSSFDMLWAHSVFTHLPIEHISVMVSNAANLMSTGGKFLFTYKRGESPERTGLKQWRYPLRTFEELAESNGFRFDPLPKIWPASQRTGMMTRLA